MGKHSLTEMMVLTVNVPRGHDHFWTIIRELDAAGPWDIKAIDDQCRVNVVTISDFVRRLVRGGYAEQVGTRAQGGTGKSPAHIFRLLQSPYETPRLNRAGVLSPETKVSTLWRTMKMIKLFTIPELHALASTPERPISILTVREYTLALLHVAVLAPAAPKQVKVDRPYRLVRNLGPKAPSIMRSSMVFDRNAGEVIGVPVLVEVAS